eukprot:gnl/TRDRNA2_/TRDRNA2_179099_c0_seq1.p1 gnl/TRDRNA2_/TRDRNA2_179099_c0~~gnl/TRDRNA2_/TRDRNA2_179099_c0_seq1.p1  ORF type:complete len:277 (+),score=83.54 gnl/TRDRNA2_/TRDRNA2_179099_c0_seq1:89-919(+)
MAMAMIRAVAAFAVLLTLSSHVCGDEAAQPTTETSTGDAKSARQDVLDQLTLDVAVEVIDERTFTLRDKPGARKAKAGKTLIRLGNVEPIQQGSMSDEEYYEKVETAKDHLKSFVQRKPIYYKAAPDEHQLPKPGDGEDVTIIADAWTIKGVYVSKQMIEAGHLSSNTVYTHELAKDILSVESEKAKKQAYAELEEVLKENAKAKQQEALEAARQAKEEEENQVEPIGLSGWLGLFVVALLMIGVLTNFGRASSKKVNLNKKKGPIEKFFSKFKGA